MKRRVLALAFPVVLSGLVGGPSATRAEAAVPAEQLEVILAIDTSGSMRPALDAAKDAANEFVSSMPADVRIGVESFADAVTVLSPPTLDRALLRAQIDSIVAGGDTALYDVVVAASRHFDPNAEHKVLVVLSDGKDEGSLATLDDAVDAVQGVHVEAISLTTAETDIDSLAALGQVTPADDAAGVSAAFARVTGLIVDVIQPVATPASAAPATSLAAPATSLAPVISAATPDTTAAPGVAVRATGSDGSTSTVALWLGAAAIFCGLLVLCVLLIPNERVTNARLGIDTPRTVSDMGVRTVSAVEQALERHGKRADLATTLAVADISAKPAEFVATVGIVALVAGLVGLLAGGPLVGVAVAVVVCLSVRAYVRRTKEKRQAAFADQLPDVLQLVTTALRSGFGLTQALESVAEEAEEPARSEFAHALVESRLGRDLSDAMRAMAQRMGSADLEWVVSAIDINRDTGGNLSEILHTVGVTIRERGRMAREVRTLTAEGRLSARILIAFPLLMALWQWRVNPDSFELLLHGGGLVALVVAGILMAVGIVWVHKIVDSVAL
jgi:tight adherence protein B